MLLNIVKIGLVRWEPCGIPHEFRNNDRPALLHSNYLVNNRRGN
jgi:hypothetical protein